MTAAPQQLLPAAEASWVLPLVQTSQPAINDAEPLAHHKYRVRCAATPVELEQALDLLREQTIVLRNTSEENRKQCEAVLVAGLADDAEGQLDYEAHRHVHYAALPEWAQCGVRLLIRQIFQGKQTHENGYTDLDSVYASISARWGSEPGDVGRHFVLSETPTIELARMVIQRASSFDYVFRNRMPRGESPSLHGYDAVRLQPGHGVHTVGIAQDNPVAEYFRHRVGIVVEYAFRAQLANDIVRHFQLPDDPQVAKVVLAALPPEPWDFLSTNGGENVLRLAEAAAQGTTLTRFDCEKLILKPTESVRIRLQQMQKKRERKLAEPAAERAEMPAAEAPPVLLQREVFQRHLRSALNRVSLPTDAFDAETCRRLFALLRKGVHSEHELLRAACEEGSGAATLERLREERRARRTLGSGVSNTTEPLAEELLAPRVHQTAPLASISYPKGGRSEFISSLPAPIQRRASARLERIRQNRWGDATAISSYSGAGALLELRFPGKDGYRIYVGQHHGALFVVGGGTKDTQTRDISVAIRDFASIVAAHSGR